MQVTAKINRIQKLSDLVKVHMTRKISHYKNTLILKALQSRVKWHFSFCDNVFFVAEIFKLSYYANLATDDIISCASTVVWLKIKNIYTNNKALRLKLGRDVAP